MLLQCLQSHPSWVPPGMFLEPPTSHGAGAHAEAEGGQVGEQALEAEGRQQRLCTLLCLVQPVGEGVWEAGQGQPEPGPAGQLSSCLGPGQGGERVRLNPQVQGSPDKSGTEP